MTDATKRVEHTPGPWRLNGDVIDGPDHTPLVCRGTYAPDVRMKGDNWHANARAISLVPDMLELLAEIAWGDSHPNVYREKAAALHTKARG